MVYNFVYDKGLNPSFFVCGYLTVPALFVGGKQSCFPPRNCHGTFCPQSQSWRLMYLLSLFLLLMMVVGRLVEYHINHCSKRITAWSSLPKAGCSVTSWGSLWLIQETAGLLCHLPFVWPGSRFFLITSCLSFPTCDPQGTIAPYLRLRLLWRSARRRAARLT